MGAFQFDNDNLHIYFRKEDLEAMKGVCVVKRLDLNEIRRYMKEDQIVTITFNGKKVNVKNSDIDITFNTQKKTSIKNPITVKIKMNIWDYVEGTGSHTVISIFDDHVRFGTGHYIVREILQ